MTENQISQSYLRSLQERNIPISFPLENLSIKALKRLYNEFSNYDSNRFNEARKSLLSFLVPDKHPFIQKNSRHLLPCTPSDKINSPSLKKKPVIGLVILAGGQATRMGLDSNSPKALLEISPVRKKTLLQLHFDKAKAYYESTKASPVIALFVSEATYHPIRSALEKENYYGFDSEKVFFAIQPSLPFLTEEGKIIVSDEGHIMHGPDGNGSILYTLSKQRILEAWHKIGVDIISVAIIDNPLIDPFYDPLIQSVLHEREDTLAFTGIRKVSDTEKVGLFVKDRVTNRLSIVEYSELSHNQEALEPFTLSDFTLANISQCAFPLRWALNQADMPLPWHAAKKTSQGLTYYKMEQFLFDLLEFAPSQKVLSLDRDFYFAPIKNREGEDSVESAQKKFIWRERILLKKLLTHLKTPQEVISRLPFFQDDHSPVELDPFWYYSTPKRDFSWEAIISCIDKDGYVRPYTAYTFE